MEAWLELEASMAKNPLAHALAQIDFHKAKVAKWEQYVSLHRELYGDGDNQQLEAAPAPLRPATRAPVRQEQQVPKSGAIAETRAGARLILEEVGDYVQTGDMIARLADMGIGVGGIQPSSTLSARLSGDSEIESRRGLGYRLKRNAEVDGAAGSSSGDEPAAPLFTPNSADEDGREVAHDNMNH